MPKSLADFEVEHAEHRERKKIHEHKVKHCVNLQEQKSLYPVTHSHRGHDVEDFLFVVEEDPWGHDDQS